VSGVKDVFGGEDTNEARRKIGGHYWVGIGTSVEHRMTCRRGPTDEPCDGIPYCEVCGKHLDEHHSDNQSQTETFLAAAKLVLDDTAYERLRKTMLEERPPKTNHDFVRKERQ
jgi:hypothetical protein